MQIDMKQPILQKNDSIAAELRQRFADNRVYVVDLLASPGSGKTTVAVKLAARLAGQKRDVALLLCDMNTPMLPCICLPVSHHYVHPSGVFSDNY